jgi:iron complex outermembrane recepter protein
MRATSYMSTPLNSIMAADLSVNYDSSNGYITNIYTDNDHAGSNVDFAARSKFLIEPNDNAKVTVILDYSRQDDRVDISYSSLLGDNSDKLIDPHAVVGSAPYTTSSAFDGDYPITSYGAGVDGRFTFGSVDLISLSGFRHSHANGYFDIDDASINPVNIDYGPESVSYNEDLRLQSAQADSTLKWVVGTNYFDSMDTYAPFVVLVPLYQLTLPQTGGVRTHAIALYGQGTDRVTDKLSVTVGARYNHERKEAFYASEADGVPFTTSEKSWNDFSPKVTADYKFLPKTMGYVTISQGWKSGVFNPSSFQATPVNPEKLTDYEVGLKSDVSPNLRANVAMYYYDYADIQTEAYESSNVATVLSNAAKATLYGLDADLTGVATDVLRQGDSLSVNGGIA